jgi:hypothetical protein
MTAQLVLIVTTVIGTVMAFDAAAFLNSARNTAISGWGRAREMAEAAGITERLASAGDGVAKLASEHIVSAADQALQSINSNPLPSSDKDTALSGWHNVKEMVEAAHLSEHLVSATEDVARFAAGRVEHTAQWVAENPVTAVGIVAGLVTVAAPGMVAGPVLGAAGFGVLFVAWIVGYKKRPCKQDQLAGIQRYISPGQSTRQNKHV